MEWACEWVAQSCPTLSDPADCSPPGSSVHGILQTEIWSGKPFPSPGDLPNPGIEPQSPAWQADSLLSKPPGKSTNTGVGSLSLLQPILQTQESNRGLLHGRWILYYYSYNNQIYISCLLAQTVKNLLAMKETPVQSLCREDPLEKEMVTHSSILAWSWTKLSN